MATSGKDKLSPDAAENMSENLFRSFVLSVNPEIDRRVVS